MSAIAHTFTETAVLDLDALRRLSWVPVWGVAGVSVAR